MKIKLLAALALLTSALDPGAFAQYRTLGVAGATPVDIAIPAGQVLQLINFTHEFTTAGQATYTQGGFTQLIGSTSSTQSAQTSSKDIYLVGPSSLTIAGSSNTKLLVSYKLFENSNVAGPTVPSTAVVIPADAAGPVSIILESSTDLVMWTAATPGSYGSSTAKRFFRVRATAQ